METLNRDEIINIVENSSDTSYLTHNYHPFPAKFIPGLPNYLIKNFSLPGDLVLDPFCGSGTTLVEAKLLSRDGIGIDVHPVAVLASKVKTNPLSDDDIYKINEILKRIELISATYKGIKSGQRSLFYKKDIVGDDYLKYIPEIPKCEHWFERHVLEELAIIKSIVMTSELSEGARDYLLMGLSAIIVQVSNQESETRYAAIKKNIDIAKVFELFEKKVKDMNRRMVAFKKQASTSDINVIWGDTRAISLGDQIKADLVVTSPPYANTYDYYLYHKLRMYWLDYDYKYVQVNEIGSRNKHSSQKQGPECYILDMKKAFENISLWLKKGKYAAFIIGDSVIKGELIKGDNIIIHLAKEVGMRLMDKVDYSQDLSSKVFNSAFRKRNKLEHILLFRN